MKYDLSMLRGLERGWSCKVDGFVSTVRMQMHADRLASLLYSTLSERVRGTCVRACGVREVRRGIDG